MIMLMVTCGSVTQLGRISGTFLRQKLLRSTFVALGVRRSVSVRDDLPARLAVNGRRAGVTRMPG